MNAPEAYIQFTPDLISDDGRSVDGIHGGIPKTFMAEFRVFIERVLTVLPRQG